MLARRNPKKYPEVGPKWDIIGGRINPGSPLLENLKREIREEVGLEYIGEPKLVAAQDILVHRYTDSTDGADKDRERLIERHVVRLTYIGELDGEPKIDEDHLEARWFTSDEIKNLTAVELDNYFKKLVDDQIVVF